jgi:transposase InsO family protein
MEAPADATPEASSAGHQILNEPRSRPVRCSPETDDVEDILVDDVQALQFNAFNNQLLYATVRILPDDDSARPIKTKGLFDCGADKQYASRKIARRLPARSFFQVPERKIEMPDGRILKTSTKVGFRYKLGSYIGYTTAYVLDIKNYELVFGLEWFCHVNPQFDWTNGSFKIHEKHPCKRTHTIHCQNTSRPLKDDLQVLHPDSGIDVGSFRAVARAAKKRGGVLWMIQRSKNRKPDTLPDIDKLAPTKTWEGMRTTIKERLDQFRSALPELPPERQWDHPIPTDDAAPVNMPAYRLSQDQLQEQHRQIDEMLARGLIRPSDSEWGFPVLFVPKPGNKWRMCIDYRALNRLTRKNKYPLPRIDDCIQEFAQARYFSKLDLLSGYWQVRIQDQDIPKTAFNTREGKYEFLVMPFGLTNAPATFQTMMNRILRKLLGKCVVVYLDDIVVYSKTREDHVRHVREVLQALQDNSLYIHPDKSVFGVDKIEFCGHEIQEGRSRPMQDKVKLIRDWPVPETVHQVRQFIGLASYYRKYIKNFPKISTVLFDLLKEPDPEVRKNKYRKIYWTKQCAIAFSHLKRKISSRPVLYAAVAGRPTRIQTDASDTATGFEIAQQDTKGNWHPIAFDGYKLTGPELNYPVHEKELLAIKQAIRTYHWLLGGQKVTVITDHHSLQYLNTIKNPSRRMARWIEEFQQYEIDFCYRKGKDAVVPDALSRHPLLVQEPSPDGQLQAIATGEEGKQDGRDEAHAAPPPRQSRQEEFPETKSSTKVQKKKRIRITAEQRRKNLRQLPAGERLAREEEWLTGLRQSLMGVELTVSSDVRKKLNVQVVARYWLDEDEKEIRKKQLHFPENGSIALKRDHSAPFIDPPARADFIKTMHDRYGHLAWPGLSGIIEPMGWWPGMQDDVQDYTTFCSICQVTQNPAKPDKEKPVYHRTRNIQPFEMWGIDLIGELPRSLNGNRWIICAIDYATSWPVVQAVSHVTADVIADFIYNRIVLDYGPPRSIVTDNGPQFTADILGHLLQQIKTRHHLISPYHPRSNGKIERYNGALGKILTRLMVGQYTALWDSYLSAAVYATRLRSHATTGFSPFYLVYGRRPRDLELGWQEEDKFYPETEENVPPDQREHLRRLLNVRTSRQEHYKELVRRAARLKLVPDTIVWSEDSLPAIQFPVNSYVLLENRHKTKFKENWFGPYRVVKAHPLGTYALQGPDGRVFRNLVHGNRLRKAFVQDEKSVKKFWASSDAFAASQGIRKEQDLHDLFQEENAGFRDLATMSAKEWQDIQGGWRTSPELVQRLGSRAFHRVEKASRPAGSLVVGPPQARVPLARRAQETTKQVAERNQETTQDTYQRQALQTHELVWRQLGRGSEAPRDVSQAGLGAWPQPSGNAMQAPDAPQDQLSTNPTVVGASGMENKEVLAGQHLQETTALRGDLIPTSQDNGLAPRRPDEPGTYGIPEGLLDRYSSPGEYMQDQTVEYELPPQISAQDERREEISAGYHEQLPSEAQPPNIARPHTLSQKFQNAPHNPADGPPNSENQDIILEMTPINSRKMAPNGKTPDINGQMRDIIHEMPDIIQEMPDINQQMPDINQQMPDIIQEMPDIMQRMPDKIAQTTGQIHRIPKTGPPILGPTSITLQHENVTPRIPQEKAVRPLSTIPNEPLRDVSIQDNVFQEDEDIDEDRMDFSETSVPQESVPSDPQVASDIPLLQDLQGVEALRSKTNRRKVISSRKRQPKTTTWKDPRRLDRSLQGTRYGLRPERRITQKAREGGPP